ncbi:MAG: hypothetical protein TREMPRED_000764 [Tremellales sp. Tagirdzhanova-0007]|nr:MAG: hypothetical protein TREMPRED_000764 [Tremellales sp. Tagirdzhanova-0007]
MKRVRALLVAISNNFRLLYPFNEGTNVLSKALLPVGNVPTLNHVLDWVLEAGLMDILLIVPPLFHAAISDHLSENYSDSTHARARIELKRHTDGEKDKEEMDAQRDEIRGGGLGEREGTARLLRRFKNFIKTDFVLLPCDLVPPATLSLSSILDKHRSAPDAVLTSVLYEPVEAVRDGEEKLLVALDSESDELLLIQPLEGLEETLDLRMSLIASHPKLSLTTRLLDAHIYIFRRTILDLLASRRSKDLDSIREQVVPWLIKGGWQKGLKERWTPILSPPRRDPFAAALARSTSDIRPSTLSFSYPTPDSSPNSYDRTPLPQTTSTTPLPGVGPTESDVIVDGAFGRKKARQGQAPWTCRVIVCGPAHTSEPTPTEKSGKVDKTKPNIEPDHLIRANSLAGYWELNRRFLRNLSGSGPTTSPRVVNTATMTDEAALPPLSSSAQISPDSLLGEGTRVGDRASIKKCIVGRHCNIGRGAKITGCVLWDFVTVEENARVENAILCSYVRIGEKAVIKDCEFGTGFEAKPGVALKSERLVAGQEA